MTRRKLAGLVAVGLIRVSVATGAMAQEAAARPSIAIADVAVTPSGSTLPPPQVSSAIVELMLNELAASERFHLYDGQWLVPEEQAGGFVDLDRVRAAASARHVDYILLGRLTTFTSEHGRKRYGGALPLPFLLGGFSREQTQLKVSVTFRVVDVGSGEIVATASGDGIGRRRATSGGGFGVIHGLPVGALAGAARVPAARDAMLDEAVRQAVHGAALELTHRALPVVTIRR
jgi:curli biogenesis system outer membrane secretion channel CsgG